MNISDKITALRKAKKISQVDLAKEAGLSREIIWRYEHNKVSLSVDVAKKITKQTLKLIDEIEELEPSIKINGSSYLMLLSVMPKQGKPTLINNSD